MESRWFHRVKLHSPRPGHEKKVEWLELFYDLIYVAAIIQLGNALSHHPGLNGFLAFAAIFLPLWSTWSNFTFYSNRFVVDDVLHRGMVFAQMMGVGCVAIFVPEVLDGQTRNFAISYAVVRGVMTLFYVRAWRSSERGREMSGRFASHFGVGLIFWIVAIFLPSPWVYVCWGVGMLVDIVTPLTRAARSLNARFPPDLEHFAERYGLLTLIVLGESFVKVLSELSAQGATPTLLAQAGCTLLITCSLWWIYFDDVAGSRIKATALAPIVWIYSHLPLTMAVTGVGVAIKKAVVGMDPLAPGPDKYRWLLCGTLALALLAVSLIDLVTQRRQSEVSDRARVTVRLTSAVFVLLLAPAGAFMPAWVFLVMITAACVSQVFFDLSMAPNFEHADAHHHDQERVFGKGEVEKPKPPEGTPPRRDVSEAVRKGTPSELRRDIYFHFMEGSWARFLVRMIAVYLVSNAIFAALYLLEPSGVSQLNEGSFLDAFAFSVQTMSTIGYGGMSPTSTYAHALVVVEAAFGILAVALVTGLMFAKASRPRSSVLFSEPVLITRYDGQRVLMFRAGNARGNEVVEASIMVSVLKDEETAEGHTMRKLHDLKLVRDTSPLFTMSWTVIHIIDEDSPLWDLTPDTLEHLKAIVATMTAFDATYAQTTHARTTWYPEDLQFDVQFVDVISMLDDGRFMVDYDVFHQTKPLEAFGEEDEVTHENDGNLGVAEDPEEAAGAE